MRLTSGLARILGPGQVELAVGRNDHDEIVEREIFAGGGIDQLLGRGFVHRFLIRGSEHIDGGTLFHLLEQRVGGRKVGMYLDVGVFLLKEPLYLRERIRQAGRAGNRDFLRRKRRSRQKEASQKAERRISGTPTEKTLIHVHTPLLFDCCGSRTITFSAIPPLRFPGNLVTLSRNCVTDFRPHQPVG